MRRRDKEGPVDDFTDYQKQGGVAVITFRNPPVNALGIDLRKGVAEYIDKAAADGDVTALVLTGDGRCFCGGADIREFGSPAIEPMIRDVIDRIESSSKPVVAAVHGVAFGGGFELALGCHFRVAAPSAQFALPEVKLGLIPGAGGTQRLPRLIGAEKALGIVLTGDPVGAEDALAMGIVDEVAGGDLVAAAVAFAEARVADASPLKRARDLEAPKPPDGFFDGQRQKIERRARGLIAPWYCIDSVENAVKLPFDEAMNKERQYFVECRESDQSKAQRHIFFAERQAAKIPGIAKEPAPRPIETAAVIGCGTMGGGLAMNFANAGIPVTVVETDPQALEKGLAVIAKTYADSVSKGRLTDADRETRMGLIEGTTDYADIAGADIVIEAVFEEMDVKKEVFAVLDRTCKPGAILATNTSTLDIDDIAAATGRPEQVIGTHFFSPAHIMRLMENVRGRKTAPETIATVMTLAKTIGKVGVLVGNADGFVGNRMYHCYTRQANFLLEEGALPQQVDRALFDFGFAMGPFAVGDVAGLDVGWAIRQRRAATRDPNERYSPIADRICELGRFGQKTGAGWYRYEEGSRAPVPDPAIEDIIVGVSGELGIERRDITDDEIRERCLYALVNEGAKILEQGLAIRSGDIDVIWVYGYGFPIHRGGPMFHADRVGVKVVHEALSRLYDIHGELLKPSTLLEEMARDGLAFEDLHKEKTK
ncbi:MAG: enoyl-CoA hydratase/isomerase family protein [Proteobacteria bacterium]|nr:enoyl-CoA hydratase/isomerase family protein [Pseudomonadota bacterium]